MCHSWNDSSKRYCYSQKGGRCFFHSASIIIPEVKRTTSQRYRNILNYEYARTEESLQGLEPDAEGVTAGTGTTPAAFYLGLCRLRGILSPPASATAFCRRNRSPLRRRRIESDAGTSLPLRPLQAELFSAASIRKSWLEIKNRCTPEGINRQNLASIRKSGLEIKNRCMQQAIFSTRSLDESLRR